MAGREKRFVLFSPFVGNPAISVKIGVGPSGRLGVLMVALLCALGLDRAWEVSASSIDTSLNKGD